MVHYLLTKQIYDKKSKKVNHHGRKSDTSSRRATGRSSGGVPEEATVITGGDSSVPVTAPEDLPGNKLWRRDTVMLVTPTLCRARVKVCVYV